MKLLAAEPEQRPEPSADVEFLGQTKTT